MFIVGLGCASVKERKVLAMALFCCDIGDGLELRLLEERHAEEMFHLVDRNRDYLRQWLPWVDLVRYIEDELDFIRMSLQQFASGDGLGMGIWHQGSLAGGIGLRINRANNKGEIGYWLSADQQGKGLATRACRVLVDYAFDELRLNRLEVHVQPQNSRSRAIPERLGFKQEGVMRQAARLYDRYIDLVLYAMLASEWQAMKREGA